MAPRASPNLAHRMDFLLQNWALILVALASAGLLAFPRLQGGSGGVTPLAAVQMINHDRAMVIDVSTAEEFAAAHIIGARNVPMAQFEEKLPQTAKNRATPLLLVCASGTRSAKAVATARKLGYEQVQAISGGLKAWRAAELPTDHV